MENSNKPSSSAFIESSLANFQQNNNFKKLCENKKLLLVSFNLKNLCFFKQYGIKILNNSDQNVQLIFIFKNKTSHKVLRRMELNFLEMDDIIFEANKENEKVFKIKYKIFF